MTRSRQAGPGGQRTSEPPSEAVSLTGDGRRVQRDGRVWISLRIQPDLLKRLDAECGERLVSRTYLLGMIVSEWLDELDA